RAPHLVHAEPRERPSPPPARHPDARAAGTRARLSVRRARVPVTVRDPLLVQALRVTALHAASGRTAVRVAIRPGRGDDRALRRELELARAGGGPPPLGPGRRRRGVAAVLRGHCHVAVLCQLAPPESAASGGPRAFLALGPPLPARPGWSPPGSRSRPTLRERSGVEGSRPLLRVLPWRHGPRIGREPPDGMDVSRRAKLARRGARARASGEGGSCRTARGPAMSTLDLREWLETDGMGGFAMRTVTGVRTRRYHGLLIGALHPPDERVVLVSGIEAWIEVDGSSFALTSQRYGGDVLHPDGATRIERFELDPWPRWTCRVSPEGAVEGGL